MNFNTVTGELSGTPTTVQSNTFLVTAINASGSITRTFSLTVTAAALQSGDATLSTASKLKGQTLLSLGSPNPASPANGGAVTLSSIEAADTTNAGSFNTLFSPTNAGASITRVGKIASGQPFGSAYNGTDSIINGDSLIIEVTAQDGVTIVFYYITVTVSAPPPPAPRSTDATLSTSSTIKGVNVLTLGTPSSSGNPDGGAVTLTATQAASTSNSANWITAFRATNASAQVTSVIRQRLGGPYGDEYNVTSTIANGDIFYVTVTAEAQGNWLTYLIRITVSAP
jgi:hypothetical protein